MLSIVGWREWVRLPELGLGSIKAKVDTGARTSALHALAQEPFMRDGAPWVRFVVEPRQRDQHTRRVCEAPVVERRLVRNSGGHCQQRYVIRTQLSLGGLRWPIELTLTARPQMGFRMLLGRSAIKGRFVVDPGRSYLQAGSDADQGVPAP